MQDLVHVELLKMELDRFVLQLNPKRSMGAY